MSALRVEWFEIDTIADKITPEQGYGRRFAASFQGRTMQIESGPGELIGWIVGSLAAFGLAFRKYIAMWLRGGSDIAREKATAALMENFRSEIERLAKLNNELSIKLGEMQRENMMLREEIGQLRETIGSLHHNPFPPARQ